MSKTGENDIRDTGERKAYGAIHKVFGKVGIVLLPFLGGAVGWGIKVAYSNGVTAQQINQVLEKAPLIEQHDKKLAVFERDLGYIKSSVDDAKVEAGRTRDSIEKKFDTINERLSQINITGRSRRKD